MIGMIVGVVLGIILGLVAVYLVWFLAASFYFVVGPHLWNKLRRRFR